MQATSLEFRPLRIVWDSAKGITYDLIDTYVDGQRIDIVVEGAASGRCGMHTYGATDLLAGGADSRSKGVELQICSCCAPGCNSLKADICVDVEAVVWSNFTQGCMNEAIPFGDIEFPRYVYDAAMMSLRERLRDTGPLA